jgi:hypothetical protein
MGQIPGTKNSGEVVNEYAFCILLSLDRNINGQMMPQTGWELNFKSLPQKTPTQECRRLRFFGQRRSMA